ncbi:MAG: NAD(P)-dependent oxidoreductase [Candidatus Moraniibacteriota bacterium]
MEKIKVCITGHDGFIGTNLLRLLKENDDVQVVPFVGDLLKKEDVKAFFNKNKNIKQIIHLVGAFFGGFDDLFRLNVLTMYNLLNVASQNSVEKIIFTSSGAVYGEPIGTESFENDSSKPNTDYGLAKKITEDVVFYFYDKYKLDYIILRFPNVYGNGNKSGVIFNFTKDIEEKGEITVCGDGNQSRNFLNVSDACGAIEKSIFYKKSGIFNISNPIKTSIDDLVKIFQEKYKFKIKRKEADNDLKDLLLSIDKAKKELGFSPQVTKIKL